jgi:hypothetical protein
MALRTGTGESGRTLTAEGSGQAESIVQEMDVIGYDT